MGTLGIAILNAMRDQGWLVLPNEKVVFTTPSMNVMARVVPITLYQEENERKLRVLLLTYVVVDGLEWPWPPDHREYVKGEVPISE